MKSLIDKFTVLVTRVIEKLNMPYSHKKFPIEDYDPIHEYLEKLEVPFAVILNSIHGSGSNKLIKLANICLKNKRKIGVTHASVFIGMRENNRSKIVEEIGDGFKVSSLKAATCQKDEVVILIPKKDLVPLKVQKKALVYIEGLITKDQKRNLEYDLLHDFRDPLTMDCSEVSFQALDFAYKHYGLENPLEKDVENRFGRETFTPADLAKSSLFEVWYHNTEKIRNW